MNPSQFLTKEQQEKIKSAIKLAETNTSGEIRLHIEKHCNGDVLDRAAWLFGKLKMQKTAERNGVLFYLAVVDHKFAILGDAGINAVTGDTFWDSIREKMQSHFAQQNFVTGLEEGILMAGDQLKEYFPFRKDDVNELPDDISFG